MLNPRQIEDRIKENLPGSIVKANDLTGGGDHWQLSVTALQFSGLSLIDQHKLIYQALGEWMKKEIHALTMSTKTPD